MTSMTITCLWQWCSQFAWTPLTVLHPRSFFFCGNFRRECQGQQLSVPQVRDAVSPDPLAPLRTPLLLLRHLGEGAGEMARRLPGLCPTHQRRWDAPLRGNARPTPITLKPRKRLSPVQLGHSAVYNEKTTRGSLDINSRYASKCGRVY